MDVQPITESDLDWLVTVLAERRRALAPLAPIFWRPATRAEPFHRRFLTKLLTSLGGKGYRTDTAALVAAPREGGWTIDDATVPGQSWIDDSAGLALWNAFAEDCAGDEARMVCPVYEEQRYAFARRVGLQLTDTWWLLELPGDGGGEANVSVDLPGADAFTTAAPPVYAPPGPMLFLPRVTHSRAVAAAVVEAPTLGCAGIVINQRPDDDPALTEALTRAGLRRHCEYYTGAVASHRQAKC